MMNGYDILGLESARPEAMNLLTAEEKLKLFHARFPHVEQCTDDFENGRVWCANLGSGTLWEATDEQLAAYRALFPLPAGYRQGLI